MLGMQSGHAAHGCMQFIQPEAMRLQVSDIAEVYHLSKLPDLQILSLSDNPVTADEDYRAKVIIKFAQENNSQGIRSCECCPVECHHGIAQLAGTPQFMKTTCRPATATVGLVRSLARWREYVCCMSRVSCAHDATAHYW